MKWRYGIAAVSVVLVACSETTLKADEFEEYSCQTESSSSEEEPLSSSVSELVFVRSSSSLQDNLTSSSAEFSSSSSNTEIPIESSAAVSSSSHSVFRITGCLCEAAATEVDFETNPSASWSVSGCESDASIEHYEWGDLSSKGPLALYYFSYVGESVAPRVVVYDSDMNYVIVSCPEVRAVNKDGL